MIESLWGMIDHGCVLYKYNIYIYRYIYIIYIYLRKRLVMMMMMMIHPFQFASRRVFIALKGG